MQQLASIATAKLMSTLFKKNESSDVGAGAEKLSSAAKELGAAAALLLVANSLSSIGFADGGFTGPGGKYQPAGIVHKNEYVQPSERMREPGALAFMRDFHVNGMRAIGQWRGYFDGGFVTPAAPSLLPAPRYTFADGGLVGGGGAPQLNMRLVNLIDRDALVGDYLDDPGSDRVFVNKIGRNAAAIAQLIGGGS